MSQQTCLRIEFSLELGLLNFGLPRVLTTVSRLPTQRSDLPDIFDVSNTCRRIRSLQHVSFAYTFGEPARSDVDVIQAAIVDVVGFEHSNESIRETTIQSWIQDPRVMDQRRTQLDATEHHQELFR